METLLVRLVLMVLVLLVIVPAATDGGVRVRNAGFFRALFTLLLVGLLNTGLWMLVGLSTLGVAILANVLLFGLIGLLINGTAFVLASEILPEVLYVRSFGSACWASLIMTVASMVINHQINF